MAARAVLIAVAIALLAAPFAHAVVFTSLEDMANAGIDIRMKYAGDGSTVFAWADGAPSCLATPYTLTGTQAAVLSMCGGTTVSMLTRDEQTFMVDSTTYTIEEEGAGTATFSSYDTDTNMLEVDTPGGKACLKLMPDSTTSGNLVAFFLHTSGDECDNANWVTTNYPDALTDTSEPFCDLAGGASVSKYVVAPLGCPSPGSCDGDIDCGSPSACMETSCNLSTNTCEESPRPDGSFCNPGAMDVCVAGSCESAQDLPSWLPQGNNMGYPVFTFDADGSNGDFTCLPSGAMPAAATTGSGVAIVQACPSSSTPSAGYSVVVQTQADTSDALDFASSGRMLPVPTTIGATFFSYDATTNLARYLSCSDDACNMACLMVVGADPSNPMAGDLGFLVFEVAPGASFDTCDRANYPADPSDPSTWNAACQPGTAYMYGGSFDYASDCAGNPVGDGAGGSECSVSDDVWMWRGLLLTTNQANCAYVDHCEEIELPGKGGERGWALGRGQDMPANDGKGIMACDSCDADACPMDN